MLSTLKTIFAPIWWSLPYYRGTRSYIQLSFMYDLSQCIENAQLQFVWKLPLWTIYWAVIRAVVITEQEEFPGDITASDLLKRLKSDV